MAKKRIDYTKMHLISQGMYDKLIKCLSDDKKPTPPDDSHNLSMSPTIDEPMQADDPIPGPSTINPSTGEYYNIPTTIPPEFQYEESTIDPTGNISTASPNISMFESYDSDSGTHHSRKKGKKTDDPSKIKSSKNIQKKYEKSLIPRRIRNRGDLIPYRTLPTISEESVQHVTPQQVTQPRSIEQQTRPALEYRRPELEYFPPGSRDELPDFSFTSPPRPLRTSTPKPTQIPQPILRLPITHKRSSQSNTPVSQPLSTRSAVKLLPLQSCGTRPKVKVTYSDGDSSIKNLPTLGKFKCPHCEVYLSTKYSLTRHVQRMHTPPTETTSSVSSLQLPLTPLTSESNNPSSFQTWSSYGKRTSSDANLKQHQQRKFKTNPADSKKRFDSWNL